MGEGAVLLRGKALPLEDEVIAAVAAITVRAPFRNMVTPGGFVMSVAMTNCGAAGWVTDRKAIATTATIPKQEKSLGRTCRTLSCALPPRPRRKRTTKTSRQTPA